MAATYSPTTCSTIGVAELNDPVRNGKGWDLSAITTLIIGNGRKPTPTLPKGKEKYCDQPYGVDVLKLEVPHKL